MLPTSVCLCAEDVWYFWYFFLDFDSCYGFLRSPKCVNAMGHLASAICYFSSTRRLNFITRPHLIDSIIKRVCPIIHQNLHQSCTVLLEKSPPVLLLCLHKPKSEFCSKPICGVVLFLCHDYKVPRIYSIVYAE